MKRYQTFGARFGAAIIDALIFLPVNFLGWIILGDKTETSIAWLIAYNGLSFFYSVFLHGKYGQTVGKKVFHVKVVQYNNEEMGPGFKKAFIRDSVWIGLVAIDILLALFGVTDNQDAAVVVSFLSFGWGIAELVTMLFNEKRRAVHDLIAGTVVIDVSEPTALEKILMQQQSGQLNHSSQE